MERKKAYLSRYLLLYLFFLSAAALVEGQAQQEVDILCGAAGFSGCCFFQSCQLPSGCFCDRGCYDRNDCCIDVPDLNCADVCLAGNPCGDNGNCSNGIFNFVCDCHLGFTGRQCDINIDDCADSPCENGTCTDLVNAYSCLCDEGFTGVNCDIDFDECSIVTCQNNGTCMDEINGFSCECPPGFAGEFCQEQTDCTSEEDSCLNGGICRVNVTDAGVRSPSCECQPGFTGASCEINIDDCAPSPCVNNGTCFDLVNDFMCSCPPGFTGQRCEIDIDICAVSPCKNDALCVELGNTQRQCFCRNGYTGNVCQINIDDCVAVNCENDGICIDGVAEFTCDCTSSFTGRFCEVPTSSHPCFTQPCINNGTCVYVSETEYECMCESRFTGENCSVELQPCELIPCQNNATCLNMGSSNYECLCPPGLTGDNCEVEIDECDSSPCMNDATCIDRLNGYFCQCLEGYTGQNCETNIDDCSPSLCQNNASCVDLIAAYRCECLDGFTGPNCEINIDDCEPNPCGSQGNCSDGINNFTCICNLGFTGPMCDINIPDCVGEPCANNGTCIDRIGGYECMCASGFTGEQCGINIDDCAEAGCFGLAMCIDGVNSFRCICPFGFTGELCDTQINFCASAPCLNNGSCTSTLNGAFCECSMPFTGQTCEVEVGACDSSPCSNNATCLETDGGFMCECLFGYTGFLCDSNIDFCEMEPCLNNATCISLTRDYRCECLTGFTGDDCGIDINECVPLPCQNDGICVDLVDGYECMCPNGFTGTDCQINIDDCASSPCYNNGTCMDQVANYSCVCREGYGGRNCELDTNLCDPQPCMNGANCTQNLTAGTVECSCLLGFQGIVCESDIDECEADPCQNGGTCSNAFGSYTCQCAAGFTGTDCEFNAFDDCSLSVCFNNATCIDFGPSFRCDCPPGYTGTICDLETNECLENPCLNEGQCVDEFLNFTCSCLSDYTGRLCEISLNPCSSSPCLNNAQCVNGPPTSEMFDCVCEPGFTGDLCEENIDDCNPNMCENGATCIDDIDGFNCTCADGFVGSLCEINEFNDCRFDICLNGGECIDIGAGFRCECAPGFMGVVCEFGTNECLDNPCFNGGTCRDLVADYMCICVEGFTGEACETDIDDCIGINCNNGSCEDRVDSFSCSCNPGFTGDFCDIDINECFNVTCLNSGTCQDLINDFVCKCPTGFSGEFCGTNIDDCIGIDCNNGQCVDLLANYTCQCDMGYMGDFCEQMINDCAGAPCLNNAICIDLLNNFTCSCVEGFDGRLCEINIDDCENSTCLNGGTCMDGINEYECACIEGYTGAQCETDIDDCIGINCNNGSCEDRVDSFSCSCNPGFTGDFCDIDINECFNVTCFNNGTCQDLINDFACECPTGFSGDFCGTNIDDCIGINCNNGQCMDLLANYTCQCDMGYMGDFCEQMINDCAGAPCLNNATCIDLLNNFTCSCVEGFDGRLCEINIDDCENSTCLNGGTCMDGINEYECACIEGYTGAQCETDIDDCIGINCNNGSCEDRVDSFSCSCNPGFTGDFCDIDINECFNVTCFNNGTCQDLINDFVCECPTGFSGDFCGTNIDDCIGIDCNNGQCMDLLANYTCQCDMGYMGDFCEQMINDCAGAPCLNNATCIDLLNNFTCSCVEGFDGRLCEINIDDCENSTCLNGGTCMDGINEYECACAEGYTGRFCNVLINLCDSFPCMNNGTCLPGVNTYTCSCSPLYTGSKCDIMVDLCQMEELCDNNGTCTSSVVGGLPSFECDCIGPYTGNSCEEFDPCVEVPCLNGGECTFEEDDVSYGCNCSSPYIGPNCEVIDVCVVYSPCLNEATCTSSLPSTPTLSMPPMTVNSTYQCACADGFTGVDCETVIPPCFYSQCENGATCMNDISADLGYTCSCQVGFFGQNCSRVVAVPAFSGQSYYSANISDSGPSAPLSITLSFRTRASSGVVLFIPGESDTFILLRLVNLGTLSLDYVGASGTITVTAPVYYVSDGLWHSVTVVVAADSLSLAIDSRVMYSSPISSQGGSFTHYSVIYIGGLGGVSVPSSIFQSIPGLVGCVDRLSTNGQPFQNEFIDGERITECVMGACTSVECSGNGVCIESPSLVGGFVCECNLGYTGAACDQELNVVVPFFNGLSYLLHALPGNTGLTLSVAMTVLTNQSNGLLLYTTGSGSDYFSLGVVSGFPLLRVSVNSSIVELSSSIGVNDGLWHVISASRADSDVRLVVDGNTVMQTSAFPPNAQLSAMSPLYIGGVPFYSQSVQEASLQSDGYLGCIHDFQVQEMRRDIVDDALSGVSISQCEEPVCSFISCQNGGACIETGTSPGFACECLSGYTGEFCEILIPLCVPNPCNGGLCSQVGITFSCLCPLGTGGRICDRDIEITIPKFIGNSYIAYPPFAQDVLAPVLTVRLRIYPTSSSGLILFSSYSDLNFGNFLSLSLVDSYLHFSYDLGFSTNTIISSSAISLNTWHYVVFTLQGANATLSIDSQDPQILLFTSPFSVLEVRSNVFLGGYSSFVNISSLTGTAQGFEGSISLFEINGREVDLIFGADFGYGIAQSNVSTCVGNPCLNGGICMEMGPSFVCECSIGYNGPLCGSMVDPCVAGAAMCADGSTCQASSDGLSFICLCPLNRVGQFCDEVSTIAIPSFNGSSYLEYSFAFTNASQTSIQITFNPSSSHGLLLHFGNHSQQRDFLSLSLINNRVQFRYDLGSGVAIITSPSLTLNSWHTVYARRDGRSGSLRVDDGIVTTGSSPGTLQQLPVFGNIRLGGVFDSNILSPHVGTDIRYQGCIGTLKVDGRQIDLIDSAINGQGITQCIVDTCSSDLCANGGTCQNQVGGFTCVCRLGYAGDTCNTEINVVVPSFNGASSYISYPSIVNAFAATRIYMEIRPYSLNGLILFNGYSTGSDYIALLLRNGYVELWFELGRGPAIIVSTSPLTIEEWHTIEVVREGRRGTLTLNGVNSVEGSAPGTFTGLQIDSDLFIGGAPYISLFPPVLNVLSGLNGCIRELSTREDGVPTELFLDATSGADITECPGLTACEIYECQNGGNCTNTGPNTAMCTCPLEYTGQFCETRACPGGDDPCQNNGLCSVAVATNGSLLPICICSLPFGGEYCTERVSFSEVSISTSGFLEYGIDSLSIDVQSLRVTTAVQLTLTILSIQDGSIFFMGAKDIPGDYIQLELQDQYLFYRFELGSGTPFSIRSEERIQPATTYTVRMDRSENQGSLAVSGQQQEANEGDSLNLPSELDLHSDSRFVIYLGNNGGFGSNGFEGCISELLVGTLSDQRAVQLDSALEGQQVTPCNI